MQDDILSSDMTVFSVYLVSASPFQLERLFHEKPLKSASKAAENALELIR